jgi:hypothetical protein
LPLGVAECSRSIDRHVGVEPFAHSVMAGNAAQTSSEMPAKISFLRPVASMARATRASSNAFTGDVVDLEDHLQAVRSRDVCLIHEAQEGQADLRAYQREEADLFFGVGIGLIAAERDLPIGPLGVVRGAAHTARESAASTGASRCAVNCGCSEFLDRQYQA